MEENQSTKEQERTNDIVTSEPTGNPTAPEAESPSHLSANENKVTTIEPQSKNPEPETESMEVHKHPHHVMHKKKWNEYLLEFFMLFLAVFLGFVAENIRENISEHEREKKFAGHLLTDLRHDSALFQRTISEFKQRQVDQVLFFKRMSGDVRPSDSLVFRSFFALLRLWTPQFATATYNQMKMSGSLRYIRNDKLTTELQEYYDARLPQIDKEIADVRKVWTDRIVPYMIVHFKFQDLADTSIARYTIVNRTGNSDQELTNIMGVYGGGWDAVFALHQNHLRQAEKLIGMIKSDYHLN